MGDQQEEADREAKKVKSVNTEEFRKALEDKEALEKSRDDLKVYLVSLFQLLILFSKDRLERATSELSFQAHRPGLPACEPHSY